MKPSPYTNVDVTSPEDIDSILLVSFGGPEKPEDVLPFLHNVTASRNIPEERLQEVAEHYLRFGGKSPINDQARDLIEALEAELSANGPDLPIYWGNRNWYPLLADTMQQMKDDGRQHAVAFVTSAYSSYSSCHQYRDDIANAQLTVGPEAPRIDKIRQFYNHPGFIGPMVDNAKAALTKFDKSARDNVRLVFTAHSIPTVMANSSRYEAQLREASRLVAEAVGGSLTWDLVYQSRSGSPQMPWLEPDVLDHLDTLPDKGITNVLLIPVGFISDHMEVVFDLDTEAAAKAAELGIHMQRAATVGTAPAFVGAIAELIRERSDQQIPRRALGIDGPVGCLGDHCCPPPPVAEGSDRRMSSQIRTNSTETPSQTSALR